MKEKNLFYYTIAMLIFFTWGITTCGEASIYKEASTSKNYYEGFITGYKKSLSDSKISRFAESLLFRFNPDLQHKISLEVNQGMVSVFVKNTLSAESMFRKDADIIRDIQRALQFESDLLPTNLSLLSKSGKVTVKGKVKTPGEKELIEKIMTKIAGVEEISNQLQIVDSKVDHIKSAVNDPGVCSDLLQWNINVGNKVFKLYVNRDNETITVRGEAEDWEQKDQVENVVKMRAPGNFQIINEINIQKS